MKVCQCDRCGRIFEPHEKDHAFWSQVIQIGEETFDLVETFGEIDKTYDICSECFEDFQKWFKRGKIRGKE